MSDSPEWYEIQIQNVTLHDTNFSKKLTRIIREGLRPLYRKKKGAYYVGDPDLLAEIERMVEEVELQPGVDAHPELIKIPLVGIPPRLEKFRDKQPVTPQFRDPISPTREYNQNLLMQQDFSREIEHNLQKITELEKQNHELKENCQEFEKQFEVLARAVQYYRDIFMAISESKDASVLFQALDQTAKLRMFDREVILDHMDEAQNLLKRHLSEGRNP